MTHSSVQLTLASGSRAGLVATIHPGYYLIGRDGECQIRPKSRSVSRKHCLLHHVEGGLQVFDLESTSGTRVAGDKIPAKQWVCVGDGAELRLGKIAFHVSVRKRVDAPPVAVAAGVVEPDGFAGNMPDAPPAGDDSPGVMVTGTAWQEVDIAAFLESEDDAAREERYENIRTKRPDESSVLDHESESESDSQVFGGITTHSEPAEPTDAVPKKSASKPSSAAKPPKRAKPKKARVRSTGTGWDLDRIKLLVTCLGTLAVVGYLIYSFVHFWNGEPANIVNGID
ncbi:MAG: FHA domain-containing protein [Planctomycetota bacterium]